MKTETDGLKPGRLKPGRLKPGRLDTGRLDTGRLDTGRLDTGRLDTGRLTLRPVSSHDIEAFMGIAGDWEVARMTSDLPHPLTLTHAESWLQPSDDDVRFAIMTSGRMIGTVGYFVAAPGVAELGFILARSHWGWGYASEAAGAVVAYGFGTGELDMFTSAHFVTNVASCRVLAKVGFTEAGRQKAWCVSRGCDVPVVCYELSCAAAMAASASVSARVETGPPAVAVATTITAATAPTTTKALTSLTTATAQRCGANRTANTSSDVAVGTSGERAGIQSFGITS